MLQKITTVNSHIKKYVIMTRECHSHTVQTNPQHHKEDAKKDL